MSVQSSHLPTRNPEDGKVYLPFAVRYTYKHSDLDASFKKSFPIPAGVIVLGILHRIMTPFAGASPAIQIGDGSGAEVWASLNTTNPDDITPTADNHVFCSLAKGGVQPKFYGNANRVIVTGTPGLTAGEAELYILYSGQENLS